MRVIFPKEKLQEPAGGFNSKKDSKGLCDFCSLQGIKLIIFRQKSLIIRESIDLSELKKRIIGDFEVLSRARDAGYRVCYKENEK